MFQMVDAQVMEQLEAVHTMFGSGDFMREGAEWISSRLGRLKMGAWRWWRLGLLAAVIAGVSAVGAHAIEPGTKDPPAGRSSQWCPPPGWYQYGSDGKRT